MFPPFACGFTFMKRTIADYGYGFLFPKFKMLVHGARFNIIETIKSNSHKAIKPSRKCLVRVKGVKIFFRIFTQTSQLKIGTPTASELLETFFIKSNQITFLPNLNNTPSVNCNRM